VDAAKSALQLSIPKAAKRRLMGLTFHLARDVAVSVRSWTVSQLGWFLGGCSPKAERGRMMRVMVDVEWAASEECAAMSSTNSTPATSRSFLSVLPDREYSLAPGN
jgi:hypothetical protein